MPRSVSTRLPMVNTSHRRRKRGWTLSEGTGRGWPNLSESKLESTFHDSLNQLHVVKSFLAEKLLKHFVHI